MTDRAAPQDDFHAAPMTSRRQGHDRRRPNHALEPMTAGRWLVWALWLVAVLVGLGVVRL